MRYNSTIHQIPRQRPQTSYGLAGSTSPKVYLCSNCLAERVSGHGDTCPRCTAITDLHKHSETLGVSEFTYRLMIAVSMLAAVAVLLAAFLYLGQI